MQKSALAGIVTERDTISACRRGDSDALRQLYHTHRDQVFSIALACLGGDRAAAEDIAQEVFVRLPERLWGFRREAALSTWLYRITVNACRDELRRRKRVPARPGQPVGDDLETILQRRELHLALATLPEKLRAPLVLRYFEERSYEEIAEALNCPTGTVASRLSRGLQALARRLGENP